MGSIKMLNSSQAPFLSRGDVLKVSKPVGNPVAVAKSMTRTAKKLLTEEKREKAIARSLVENTKAPSKAKGVVTRIAESRDSKVLTARLMLWLKLLQDPFNAETVRCPVNYNPVPSWKSTLARTTVTGLSIPVPSGRTVQFSLFPGHAAPIESVNMIAIGPYPTSMDGVAYHSLWQSGRALDGTTLVAAPVGPINVTTSVVTATPPRAPTNASCVFVNGYLGSGIPTGTYATTTDDAIALGWDLQLPYTTTSDGQNFMGRHARWKMVAMGIKFRNITPELSRGGNVVTVIPNNSSLPEASAADSPDLGIPVNSQAAWEVYPSFTDHGCPDKTIEVSFVPQAQDLAFWHVGEKLALAEGYQSDFSNIYINHSIQGMQVFFNAPQSSSGSLDQTYAVEIVYHWELAGTLFAAVSQPTIHQPADRNVIEPALGAHLNTAMSAKGILSTATSVARAISPFVVAGAAKAGPLASKALTSIIGLM